MVRYGKVNDEFYLMNCDQIEDVCAVVPNQCCKKNSSNLSVHALGQDTWFLVTNQLYWEEYFSQEYILEKTYLYRQ